jgi:uncharacterized membrane protein
MKNFKHSVIAVSMVVLLAVLAGVSATLALCLDHFMPETRTIPLYILSVACITLSVISAFCLKE